MANTTIRKKFKRVTVTDESNTQFHQTLNTSLYGALEQLRKEKGLDSVQALVRFAMVEFAKKNGLIF